MDVNIRYHFSVFHKKYYTKDYKRCNNIRLFIKCYQVDFLQAYFIMDENLIHLKKQKDF